VRKRAKKGFGIPLAAWLRGPLRDRLGDAVAASPVIHQGIVAAAEMRRMRDEHLGRTADHAKALWSFIVLDHWFRRHF
jgi:asparagine synthase (glutamine-hydrolysing)